MWSYIAGIQKNKKNDQTLSLSRTEQHFEISLCVAGFIDPLSDMSVDTVASELEGAMGAMGLNDATHHASVLPQGLEQPLVALPEPTAPPAPILMTPDAFSSPSPK